MVMHSLCACTFTKAIKIFIRSLRLGYAQTTRCGVDAPGNSRSREGKEQQQIGYAIVSD
jgi:hypothetical protein